ncbi:hypothetical protein [Ruficoccus sp. ZRK36]|uniref:hypothetical protein n=1 Tax=Ruficoccus sp. ZRK36 TaxID=2866311 RepID=UPI0021035999|nr:hypothetical protein [Ruficoccus sp. ZRK36]
MVLRIADELGYRPDPQMVKMMAYMRTSKRHRQVEKLAFIWLDALRKNVNRNPYARRILGGVMSRAEELGYGIEEFYAEDDGLSMARLSTILDARGISGVMVSPLHYHTSYRLDLRWERFSTVVIGRGQVGPALHQTGPDHYQGMARAMKNLIQLGYRRIGMCVSGGSLERQDHRWEGSFVIHHPLGITKAASLMLVAPSLRARDVDTWIRKTKPDIILFQGEQVHSLLAQRLKTERWDLPCATLDWLPEFEEAGLAGLNQQNEISGANAVDLVTADLLRNQRGVPREPKVVLCEATWVHGASASAVH